MANINLRVGNDALTFAEVDSNFTNLNSESFYGGITFTSGVLKFEPIGSDGTGADPYPPIQFDLDASYLNQVSSTDFADLNTIATMPDDNSTIDLDASVDGSGFVSPSDKLLISEKGKIVYNAPSFGYEVVQMDGESVDGNQRDANSSYLAHRNFVPEQVLADHFQYNSTTGTITIDTSNGGFLNRYDEVAGRPTLYSAGTAAFIAQLNHMKGSNGVVFSLYTSTGNHAYRRRITGVTYTQNASGENTEVVITTQANPGGDLGVPSGNTIKAIRIYHSGGKTFKQLSSPRAPLTPPITPPMYTSSGSPYAQVMVPSKSYRIDQADLQLSYGDNARLVCQGLVSKGHMLIRPHNRGQGVTSNGITGSQVGEMDLDNGVGGKSLTLLGGDTSGSPLTSASQQGGHLTLGAGVNTNRVQSGAVSPATNSVLSQYVESEDYDSLSDFSDSSRPLIKLFGRQSFDMDTQNSVVISAGRNYRTSAGGGTNGADRVGGDIRFLLGTGSGRGIPGDLVIEAFDLPTALTTASAGNNKPDNAIASATPFKIEWDSDNYEYKTTIPNLDASLAPELAELTVQATAANNPFDLNHDDNISSTESLTFNRFASGVVDQTNINLEQGTIIKGLTKSTYDTSETRYDKVYELPSGVESIDPRLMMFSGNTYDVLRAGVGLGRTSGDTIILGNIQKKTNGDVTFLNGLSIDGDNFHLINNSRTAKVNATVDDLTLTGNGTILTMGNAGASFNNDLDVTGDINATGDVTAFSDESIKENVEVIEDAVDKVQQLNGYTFDRTDIETSRQTGVIAQEVLKVLPEAVGEKDGIHTVAYGNMVGLLIEAIKEQQGQIDSLKEELQSIKSINK